MSASRLVFVVLLFVLVIALSAGFVLGQPTAQASTSYSLFLPLVAKNYQPPTPPSPEAVIDEAVANGTLDSETGLVYKVYAVFGDSRLPSQYRPTTSMKFGDDTMAEARVRFSTLSPANQAIIQPYLLEPYQPGSWYMSGTTQTAAAPAAAVTWKYYDTANGKVRVWFADDVLDGQNKAWAVRNAIDAKIWPALVRVMGQEPLVPPNPPNDYAKIPVFLVKSLDAYGVTTPYTGCDHTSASVEIDGSKPIGDDTNFGILQTTAHELMHVVKDSFSVKSNGNSCREYSWLSEATSNWFEDVVYPNANSERVPPGLDEFLETPHLSIDDRTGDRQYGTYTLLYLLSHTYTYPPDDPQTRIGQIWRNAATLDSIEAVDKVARDKVVSFMLPGAFWSKYYRALWHGLPTDLYQQNDSLTLGATPAADDPRYSSDGPTPVRLDGAPMKLLELKGDLKHSSSRYYHFTFPDATVRSVYLYDGLLTSLVKDPDWIGTSGSAGTVAYRPGDPPTVPDPMTGFTRGASFQVLYKIEGQDWQEIPVNSTVGVSFCRDAKDERVTDLVVIMGNTDYGRDYTLQPPGEQPVLQVSNQGCWQSTGTVTAQHQGSATIPWTATSTVTLRRVPMPAGLPNRLAPDPGYIFQTGTVNWNMPAYTQDSCTTSGSGTWSGDPPVDGTLRTINASLSGPWHRGYFIDSSFHSEFPYQTECSDGTNHTGTIEATWFDTYNSETPDTVPFFSADGTHLSGTATSGDAYDSTTWTWSLSAEREP